MIGLYYRIWVDVIQRAKSRPENRENWPMGTMVFMTIPMSMNVSLLMTILEKHILGIYFYDFKLDFLPNRLGNLVGFVLLFVLPCILINYFLIFHKHRYEKLLSKYPYKNGKLFMTYFVISMFLPVILLMIGISTGEIGITW